MYRGYSHFHANDLKRIGCYGYAKTSSLIAIGLYLSGCVATALTPPSGAPSPVLTSNLSLAPQNTDSTTDTNYGETDAAQPASAGALNGVTVPVRRPGSLVQEQPQLALANQKQKSIAEQKAEILATTNTPPKMAAAVKNSETKTAATANSTAIPVTVSAAPPKKKANKGFFALLFQSSSTKRPTRRVASEKKTGAAINNNRKVAVFRPVSKGALPGVRKLGLFGIYDAKEGANEGYYDSVRMASIGGLARTSPNGLRIQHPGVQVACLKPGLVRIIKQVQRRYGRVPVITSGYRNPARNRRAGGVRNSMHIYCKAADIQVSGISKWALAKYLRSMPGRGGVGTYCYTKSVHIDIGSKRDWNWRCRRGKRSKKWRSRRKHRS